jgi:amidase
MPLTRRALLAGSTGALALFAHEAQARGPSEVIEEVSLVALAARLASGTVTSRALTVAYLARIRGVDAGGPSLRSVVEVNPDALAIASALDSERSTGRARGPLHGVPVLLKDNIDTADRMKTTAGSLALMDAPAPKEDAAVVARLRAAGCVILGKTNLSEWANYRSSRSSSGWSARGGQTKNPYALDRTPCGSSSGSGAAVAASLCAAAVGTETWGSIQCPSSVMGVVGIKPTVGLVPSDGIVPVAHSLDTAGPMARSVRDAALMLSVLAPSVDLSMCTASEAPLALAGARLGVVRDQWGNDSAARALLEAGVAILQAAGATVVEVPLEDGGTYVPAALDVLAFEFKADLARYLERRGGALRTLDDVIAFNEEFSREELAIFGQDLFLEARGREGLDANLYRLALRKLEILQKELQGVFQAHRLDAMFGPASGVPWLIDHVRGDAFSPLGSAMCTLAGGPVVTLPGGLVRGLPFGVSIEGLRGADARVIALARAFEARAPGRVPPRYRAQSSLGAPP